MIGLVLIPLLSLGGLCLWIGATGELPWVHLRAHPVVRGCILVLTVPANAALGAAVALVFLAGYAGINAAFWAGIFAVVFGVVAQVAAFLAVWTLLLIAGRSFLAAWTATTARVRQCRLL